MDYLKELSEEARNLTFPSYLIDVEGNFPAYLALCDYIAHNDKTTLIDAIRNKPEIFKSQTVRNFIADVIEGEKKIRSGGFTHKNKAERDYKILELIIRYQAMGYPVKPSHYTKMTCCDLAGRKYFVSASTADKEIYRKRSKTLSELLITVQAPIGRVIIRLNGGVVPDNISDLDKLEKRFDENRYDPDKIEHQILFEELVKQYKRE